MTMADLDRRRFLKRAAASGAALALAGCDKLSNLPWWRDDVLGTATKVTRSVQQAALPAGQLARTYAKSDISKEFRANGTTDPQNPAYKRLAADGFADYRLAIGGLVEHPQSFSLAALRAMPAQTQITRHDCVEGWSCIGEWTGVRLSHVLAMATLKPQAKYVVFRCYDSLEDGPDGQYYESVGLADALHPQTILAYAMNGETLRIPYGAPLRVRIERQLGYKMAKYIRRIDAVANLDDIGGGKGGFWEDRGYQWYAGI
jgi:DMSO/TMAO reductase YedYZ molybdopterin-dependent catalytic subunit